jgi:predicted Zn-dependent protease
MLNESKAREILATIKKHSKADAWSAAIDEERKAHLRFARNAPTTSGENLVPSVTLTSYFGKRSGSVTVNQLDEKTLQQAVERSESIARLAPEDPEHMPLLGPQQIPATKSYFESTANAGQGGLVPGVAKCLEECRSSDVVGAGYTQLVADSHCVGNSAGFFAFDRGTRTFLSQTVRTKDGKGSGWASAVGNQLSEIDYASVAARAVQKCKGSIDARELEPGKYPAILEPTCVASMVSLLVSAMDARRADEGRSFFSKKGGGSRIGEKLFSRDITISSDPADPRAPARSWVDSGIVHKPRKWIDKGVVRTLSTSRYWARKSGGEPVPNPPNVIMNGGKSSLEELIAGTRKGLLVTSLWYIRSVQPQTLLHTGLTRDGVFWVEDGEIRHAVKNFRWNESPVAVLKQVRAMSRPVRVSPRGDHSARYVVPALKVDRFHFSSISDAV